MTTELAVPEVAMIAAEPRQYVQAATRVATELATVIKAQGLYVVIGKRAFVTVEAWTLLANMLGVHPIPTWSRPIVTPGGDDGWEARVEVRNARGDLIGAGEAMCTRGETTWAKRDEYAIRAMAQTRAISRALRNPLGFVVKLAGYEATPAEEMPRDGNGGEA